MRARCSTLFVELRTIKPGIIPLIRARSNPHGAAGTNQHIINRVALLCLFVVHV